MRRTLRWIGLGFLTVTAAGAVPSAANARFMFPAVVLLRESGRTVALSHAGADPSTGNISRDTIAMLYSSISRTTLKSEDQLKDRRFIEVAEFFGPGWIWYSGGGGQMPAFEHAATHTTRASEVYLCMHFVRCINHACIGVLHGEHDRLQHANCARRPLWPIAAGSWEST